MRILDRLATLFTAVAFAEEGDAETARRLMSEDGEGGGGEAPRRAGQASRPSPRRDVPMPGRSRA